MLLARLADDRLLVVAGDVVEPDAVRVEVVEHRHAELVPLPVVGLRPARAAQDGYKKFQKNTRSDIKIQNIEIIESIESIESITSITSMTVTEFDYLLTSN